MSWLPSLKDCPNFEHWIQEVNIPLWPVGNWGWFSNMSGLSSSTYLTCVKSNWPISNLCSESERKCSNHTRTIAGSPLSHPLFKSKSWNNSHGEPVCRLLLKYSEHQIYGQCCFCHFLANFAERKNFIQVYNCIVIIYNFQHRKLQSFQNLSLLLVYSKSIFISTQSTFL